MKETSTQKKCEMVASPRQDGALAHANVIDSRQSQALAKPNTYPILVVDDDEDKGGVDSLAPSRSWATRSARSLKICLQPWEVNQSYPKTSSCSRSHVARWRNGGGGVEGFSRRPDTVAVVMSSTEDAKSIVEYMKAGAKDYLFKGDGFLDMLGHVTSKTLESISQQRRLREAESTLRLNDHLLSRSENMASMGSWRKDLEDETVILGPNPCTRSWV